MSRIAISHFIAVSILLVVGGGTMLTALLLNWPSVPPRFHPQGVSVLNEVTIYGDPTPIVGVQDLPLEKRMRHFWGKQKPAVARFPPVGVCTIRELTQGAGKVLSCASK